jgi:enoyl-CoA hydratase/carnithine racemase
MMIGVVLMKWKTLLVETSNNVTILTLNQPEKINAMTMEMKNEFKEAVQLIKNDPDTRVLVLTGQGKSFSSGGDLQSAFDRFNAPPAKAKSDLVNYYKSFLSIRDLKIPTIAAIKGYAIGVGLCLALACDIRVASTDLKISMPFIRLGLHPGMGTTHLLTRIIGTAKTLELCLTGDQIDAQEAFRIGIVNHLVEPENLNQFALSLAEKIARNPVIPARFIKKSVYRGLNQDLESTLDYESSAQVICSTTEDMKEGLAAAREKRPPVFKGC